MHSVAQKMLTAIKLDTASHWPPQINCAQYRTFACFFRGARWRVQSATLESCKGGDQTLAH